jgi:hypothetical protein
MIVGLHVAAAARCSLRTRDEQAAEEAGEVPPPADPICVSLDLISGVCLLGLRLRVLLGCSCARAANYLLKKKWHRYAPGLAHGLGSSMVPLVASTSMLDLLVACCKVCGALQW